jgi:exonuclease SbcC
MKIARLKLKNINALQGTWEIDFQQPPLADARLFAIVGPNGSGKTSILDAITLALYGETPRIRDLESTGIGFQSSENGSAYAEVDFSVGEKSYRSRWSVRRSSGKQDTPQMSIASLNGSETVLEDRIGKVRPLVAELTGLDFKRFCRSILLAQGEFTAFLNALENERAEILEKIIGADMKREIEESIHARAEAEHEKLLQLKEAGERISAPGKETISAVEEAFEKVRDDLRETESLIEELEKREESSRRLDLLLSEQKNADEELELAKSRAAQLRAQAEQLAAAEKSQPFQEDMARLMELQADANRAETLRKEYQADIEAYQHRIDELEKRTAIITQDLEAARKELEESRKEIETAGRFDRDIEVQKDRVQELQARQEASEHLLSERLNEQSELERRISELKDRKEELERWLRTNSADADLEADLPAIRKGLTHLRDMRKKLVEQLSRLERARQEEKQTETIFKSAGKAAREVERNVKELASRQAAKTRHLDELLGSDTFELLMDQYRQRKKRLHACRKLARMAKKYRARTRGEDVPLALRQMQIQRDRLTELLSSEEARLAELEESARWRQAVRRLEEDRAFLQPGKPCPLCGSVDHPYIGTGIPDFSAADSELQAQKKKTRALQNEVKALDTKAEKLKPQAKAAVRIREEWSRTCAEAGEEWDILSPESFDIELRSSAIELKQLRSRLRIIRWRRWRAAWGDRKLRRQTDKLNAGMLLKDDLREAHELLVKTIESIEADVSSLGEDERRGKEASMAHLEKYGESLPKADDEVQLIESMEERWAEYQRRGKEQSSLAMRLSTLEIDGKSLAPEITRVRDEAASFRAELDDARKKLDELTEERTRAFGDRDPVQLSRSLNERIARCNEEELMLNQEKETTGRALFLRQADLLDASQQGEKTAAEAKKAENEILERATSAGFNSIQELKGLLDLFGQREIIKEQKDAAERALAEARFRAEAAQRAVELARSESLSDEPLETLTWKKDDAEKRRDSLKGDIEAAGLLLEQYRDVVRQKRAAEQAVAEQEKVWGRLASEEEALKSGDPGEERLKMHRLMLERLIEKANRNLEELSGRYYLRPSADEGFGLEVEDTVLEGAHRSTRTLSGGESFVVSLSLALGLSEMANRDRKIESLFLDEGFGALDDEMLYRVIATLKALRANGKMVGVISHVKRLADEIPTQIRVEKQPGGRSRISIVA